MHFLGQLYVADGLDAGLNNTLRFGQCFHSDIDCRQSGWLAWADLRSYRLGRNGAQKHDSQKALRRGSGKHGVRRLGLARFALTFAKVLTL